MDYEGGSAFDLINSLILFINLSDDSSTREEPHVAPAHSGRFCSEPQPHVAASQQ